MSLILPRPPRLHPRPRPPQPRKRDRNSVFTQLVNPSSPIINNLASLNYYLQTNPRMHLQFKYSKRGVSNLSNIVKSRKPALMFLSEPQLYQCDSNLVLAPLLATYCHHLNSEDFFNPDLALEKHKAKGGTLCLWHKALDPFASLLPTTSPAVLPLLLSVPGLSPSAHIGIYLPTRGQDQEFVLALAALSAVLQELKENHRDVPIYIRGDANTNPNNQSRFSLFQNFLS